MQKYLKLSWALKNKRFYVYYSGPRICIILGFFFFYVNKTIHLFIFELNIGSELLIMISLKDKLEEILPSVLPKDESNAIMANDLLKKISHLFPGVSTNSLKQNFSILSADPRSCLAKRAGKHGYFFRDKSSHDNMAEHVFKSDFMKEINQGTSPSVNTNTEVRVIIKKEKLKPNPYTKLNNYRSGRLHPILYKKKSNNS